MTRILAGLLLMLVVACSPPPPAAPVLTQVEVFRNPSAQIASQTNVTADRMAGEWYIRQIFASEARPIDGMSLSALPAGALQLSVLGGNCVDDICFETETLVLYEPTGPGRWTPVDPPAGLPRAELWVMWMDFDDRTAAIGTPSGEFGWIMDKNATGGGDRITAARDIMDWFGYDMARLEEVSR